MPRIPENELQRLKREVSLAVLCRDYGIELKQIGPDNLMGRCPFHEDKTPSFGVTPSKNLWNCLAGCGGGDTIQLVMKKEGVSFRHAVEILRRKTGVTPAAPVLKTRQGGEGFLAVVTLDKGAVHIRTLKKARSRRAAPDTVVEDILLDLLSDR